MTPAASPRTRRSSQAIRALLIDAAQELFGTVGYDEATSRAICEKAGVSEPLLFSNFGSKAGLFDAAIVAPFTDLLASYIASWQTDTAGTTTDTRAAALVSGLYDLAAKNRPILLRAVTHRLTNDADPGIVGRLAELLQSQQVIPTISEEIRGYALDAPATIAASCGMVLGVALLDDLLFPPGTRRPGRQRLIDEMTSMILDGVRHRNA